MQVTRSSKGEGEVTFFSAKRWDRRNRANLIESSTLRHDAQVVGSYRASNPLPLTILAAKSEDYTTAPHQLVLISTRFLYAGLYCIMLTISNEERQHLIVL